VARNVAWEPEEQYEWSEEFESELDSGGFVEVVVLEQYSTVDLSTDRDPCPWRARAGPSRAAGGTSRSRSRRR
jgi:hypothetical protein